MSNVVWRRSDILKSPGLSLLIVLVALVVTVGHPLAKSLMVNRGALELAKGSPTEGSQPSQLLYAVRSLEFVLTLAPDSCQVHRLLGFGFYWEGSYQVSRGHLEAAIANCDRDRIARQRLGDVYDILGEHELALEQWRLAGVAPGAVRRCHDLLLNRRYSDALPVCALAVEIHPSVRNGYFFLGNAYLATDDLSRARLAFERAVALDPNSASVHLAQGRALWGLGDREMALNEWEKAADLSAHPEDIYLAVGDAYYDIRENELASTWYWRAIRIDPRSYSAWFRLGRVLYRRKDCGRAMVYFDRAIGLAPSLPEPYGYTGLCLNTLGRPEEAIVSLEFAVENLGTKASFHIWLGDAYLAVGRKHEAMDQYMVGSELWPTNEDLQVKIDHLTTELEEYDPH